ncbi:MAG: response regulator [Romboutsia sp.]|nr:response regulator [Romboutsia sp.]
MNKKIVNIAILDDEQTFGWRFKLILSRVGVVTQNFQHFLSTEIFIEDFIKMKESGMPYDIIFLDINLRVDDKDGFEILKLLREKLNGHPIIAIISSSDDENDIKLAKQYGANCYIIKSGDLYEFSARMRDFKEMFINNRVQEFILFND